MSTLNPEREVTVEAVLVPDIGKGDTVVAYHVPSQTNRHYVVAEQPTIYGPTGNYEFAVTTPDGTPCSVWSVPPGFSVNVLR